MEGLKSLIRNLAFILLLATFLEMLLPNKSMRGFVQLVMGLFVIAAILNPLADFLRLEYSNEVPAWVTVPSTEMPVLAAESDTAEAGKSAVREQYKRILINQIKILVNAVDGVKDSEVEVILDEESGGFSDYPQIIEVHIKFSRLKQPIIPVNPVIISGSDPEAETDSDTEKAREIRKQVSAFMQIPEKIVKVEESI